MIRYEVVTSREFKDQDELDKFLLVLEQNAIYPELVIKMLRKLDGAVIKTTSELGIVETNIRIVRETH